MPNTRSGAVVSNNQDGENLWKTQTHKNKKGAQRKSSSPLNHLLVEDTSPQPCKKCKKDVGQESKAIKCDRCTAWVHLGCSDLSKTEYDFLEKSPSTGFKWFCHQCDEDTCRSSGKGFDQNDKIAEQSAKIDTMNTIILNLQKQVGSILDILKNNDEKIESKIKTHVEEIVDDQKEKEEKKNNLIIFNVPESGEGEGPNSEQGRELDLINVKKVLSFVDPDVKLENISKTSISRLGQNKKTKSGKPRPIRIVFQNPEPKVNLIKKILGN